MCQILTWLLQLQTYPCKVFNYVFFHCHNNGYIREESRNQCTLFGLTPSSFHGSRPSAGVNPLVFSLLYCRRREEVGKEEGMCEGEKKSTLTYSNIAGAAHKAYLSHTKIYVFMPKGLLFLYLLVPF